MRAIDNYRKIYEFLNEETLGRATKENPQLLVEMFHDKKMRPMSRAIILEYLALETRVEYYELIKEQTKSEYSFIRESSFRFLFDYIYHNGLFIEIYNIYMDTLKNNKDKIVQSTIECQLKLLLEIVPESRTILKDNILISENPINYIINERLERIPDLIDQEYDRLARLYNGYYDFEYKKVDNEEQKPYYILLATKESE